MYDMYSTNAKADKFIVELGEAIADVMATMALEPECKVSISVEILIPDHGVDVDQIVYNNL